MENKSGYEVVKQLNRTNPHFNREKNHAGCYIIN